jgi:hypothetical protein
MYMLMRHPDAAAKLRAEARRVMTPEMLAAGEVSLETAGRLADDASRCKPSSLELCHPMTWQA